MLAIYTRLSREDDASNSIENQLREGKDFAKGKFKYQIYNEGEGISGGAEIENRPELLRLINDIINGMISHVWMRNQDRLERDTFTYAYFFKIAKDKDIKVYFGDKEFDYNDPMIKIMGTILSGFNEYRRTSQSALTVRSIMDNYKEGKFHGIQPYGYELDKNRYTIINKKEAEVVRRIYRLSLEGKGQAKIAEILNNEGVQTRYNKLEKGTLTTKNKHTGEKTTKKKTDVSWAGNTIRGIITNTIYKGEKITKHGTFQVPAIVTPDHWQEVNDNLKKNRNNSGNSKPKYNYLLKGLIRCGKCWRNYYGRTRESKKDHYYMCSSKRYKDLNCGNRSINIDKIEDLVWGDLFERKGLNGLIVDYFNQNQGNDRMGDLEKEITELQAHLRSLEIQRKRTLRFTQNETLTEEEGEAELKRIRREKQSTDNRLQNVTQEIEFLKDERDLNQIQKDIQSIRANAPTASKTELLNKHIRDVLIDSDSTNRFYLITIRFKLIDTTYLYLTDYNWKKVSMVTKFEEIVELVGVDDSEMNFEFNKPLEQYDEFLMD